ncbi:hypothetical protein AB0O91_32710 [Kitasatospora sp. NPDC089797]|uniref:hypothetical protein n=1 Tax=Kitasatospora sp. NPDC089797 TaxID=3155298 RepID=UPI003416273A
MSDPVHDPRPDALADRLRLLGTRMSAPALPAAEIRRRADRRRRRRHALGATAACTAAALCLALPSLLSPGAQQPPGPQQGAATADAPSESASPRATAASALVSTETSPIDAGTTAKILTSCLGSGASKYHAVIAVRAPVASATTDGVVVAVDSGGQYVQCESKGDKGRSTSVPATFINDRLWGAGHLIEFFDSSGTPLGGGRSLALGAGHYTSDVAKVTISYGDDPTQYPAVMADGAFVYAAAVTTSPDTKDFGPDPYVHAFNAAGQEIYNQKTQPAITNARP